MNEPQVQERSRAVAADDAGPMDPARAGTDLAVAEAVRAACIRAALEAYEDAGIQGLCAEGRWEMAVQAMRRVQLP